MKKHILIMNRYNAILARRIKNSRFLYGGAVIFSTALVILIGTWLTIYEHNRFASNYNVGTSIILYYDYRDAVFVNNICFKHSNITITYKSISHFPE